MKVHRLNMKIGRHGFGSWSTASTNKKLARIETLLKDLIDGPKLNFIMSQLRASTRKRQGQRWSTGDKALSLSLLHSSPRTYRILQKTFILPSVKTLRTVMNNIDIYPGFCSQIIAALKLKVQNLPPMAKLVCVALDEMAIKEGLSYDSRRDVIEGFDGDQLSNHALVFVVKGIIHRWKQPFGFFFSSSAMTGDRLHSLLFEAISVLEDIGLNVVVTVSDQGSNNLNLFQTILKVSPSQPFFQYEEKKIFFLWDPPHLLKSIRNNLKTHGYLMGNDEVQWKHIVSFYDLDSSKPTRLAPKLTRKHLELPPFSKMRVRLAAQVLSHSVASGIKVLAQWDLLDKDCLKTAEFLENFDQLFNAFNSISLKSTAKMGHAFSATSGHKEFLINMREWMGTIKSKGSRKPACLQGWITNINSLLQLWDSISSEHGVSFLMTRQINQDCAENLFSTIRASGGARDNPDSSQFRGALRQVMVDSVMCPGKYSNCEEDVDEFLLTLKSSTAVSKELLPEPLPSVPVVPPGLPQSVASLMSMITLPPTESELSLPEKNTITYIAGYVVKKIKDKVKVCSGCLQKVICQEVDSSDQRYDFLTAKNHEEARTGLQVPNTLLIDALEKVEAEYSKVIDQVITKERVKGSLLSTLLKVDGVQDLYCEQCHVHVFIVQLMVNIRLHHTIRKTNSNLRDEKSRKNRKTLKFSHL